MAKETDIALRDEVIYCVYIRSHTEEGTFTSIAADLGRIRALGVDTIWFLPIHPIGEQGKKGSLGCPYANRDYRDVNPVYGQFKDFKHLIDAIHEYGMKCMIDVVYNHTAPDSVLFKEHPEWFYRKADGSVGNRVGEWSDVIDLDYDNRALWAYQKETLAQWGCLVDGFRCDVAPLIPLEFWKEARAEVAKLNPDCIWLAETVHRRWAVHCRRTGIPCSSDAECFEVFDIGYDYDIRDVFEAYLKGETSLSHYVDLLNFQEAVYPENYIKLRFLENHDTERICAYLENVGQLQNFTAMLYFLKGATLLYGGQEFGSEYRPSLFEREVFSRNTGVNISDLLSRMARIKKRELSCGDNFWGWADDRHHIAILNRCSGRTKKVGIFSLKGKMAAVSVDFPDGIYTNLIDDERVTVRGGKLLCKGKPIILSTAI